VTCATIVTSARLVRGADLEEPNDITAIPDLLDELAPTGTGLPASPYGGMAR